MKKTGISVIMPVYNAGKYIKLSVNSILNQTLTDFEFIIINDASNDKTGELLRQIKDKRVKIITNTENIGNYPSRNIGIKVSSGEFICVMDSDDFAVKYRLERQMHFMSENPNVGICSTWFQRFGLGPNINIKYPSNFELLKIRFLENNYCLHPGLCIRKSSFPNEESLLYNEQFQYASDYEFVSRNFKYFKICNIPEILMEYRIHPAQITSSKFAEQQQYADIIRINYLQNLGLTLNDKEKTIHLSLIKNEYNPYCDLKEHIAWCNKILEFNFHIQFFNTELLAGYLRKKLMWQRRITESRNIETLKPTNLKNL